MVLTKFFSYFRFPFFGQLDETTWHLFEPAFPFRDSHGNLIKPSFGKTWRRKVNGVWEYRQEEETFEEYENRQW